MSIGIILITNKKSTLSHIEPILTSKGDKGFSCYAPTCQCNFEEYHEFINEFDTEDLNKNDDN